MILRENDWRCLQNTIVLTHVACGGPAGHPAEKAVVGRPGAENASRRILVPCCGYIPASVICSRMANGIKELAEAC